MKQNGALVGFSANRSEFASCVCDGCHASAFVTILTMPQTEMTVTGSLRTIYRKIWLCDDCLDRLGEAVRRAKLLRGDA